MTDALTVAKELCSPPVDADHAQGELPRASGLYAWWAPPRLLPGVSGPPHPTGSGSGSGSELIYVGLARNLRTRVGRNQFRGPTGSSTLRRALVALLMPTEGYTTRWTTDRVMPVDADEVRLSAWMREHLRVTWAEHPEPKDVEAAVINELGPPLNQSHNTAHSLYATIAAARAAYRASAGPGPNGVA